MKLFITAVNQMVKQLVNILVSYSRSFSLQIGVMFINWRVPFGRNCIVSVSSIHIHRDLSFSLHIHAYTYLHTYNIHGKEYVRAKDYKGSFQGVLLNFN